MKDRRICPVKEWMERDLEGGMEVCGGEDERMRLNVLNLKSGRDLSSASFLKITLCLYSREEKWCS